MTPQHGPQAPEPRKTLLAYALELRERHHDEPFPRDGEPFPDDADHPRGNRPTMTRQSMTGIDVATIVDCYFAREDPDPGELADEVHRVHVPIYPSDLIIAAARRADRDRVLETGRWLIRNGTDSCGVTVGLALLEAVGIDAEDVDLVQTIGLLSNHFGALAGPALAKLPDGAAPALLWLAERVAGWGRVNVVRSMAGFDDAEVRRWLVRRAVDGDFLNGYFTGVVVYTGRLHELLDEIETDPELADSVGRLLSVMTQNEGMGGLTLDWYEHANVVLDAYHRALCHSGPTLQRYIWAVVITHCLDRRLPRDEDSIHDWNARRSEFRALLDRPEWHSAAAAGLAGGDPRMRWIADSIAPELNLVFVEE